MKKIFLVPHFHYDVAWAFTKEDYLYIAELILKKSLDMIKKSDFRFLIEQTYLLEQIEHRDPKLFSDIREAIEQGRLEIVDGQYIMADPMIPGGEVLVREILYGKLYAREKFGVDVPVAWAADGFGLNAQLPQIYRKSGYKWLAFRRGLPKAIGSRTSEFIWEGLDGSQILAHWMPLGYRAGLHVDKWLDSAEKLFSLASTVNILMPCGSGGIPPQEDIPEHVSRWNAEHPSMPIVIATPRRFFEALDASEKKPLPVFKWELYSGELESIFPDVVSSRISLKLAIRDCENMLLQTEKITSLAFMLGREYPDELLTDLWKKMLFLAMHDIMPSCGIDEIYEEAWEYIKEMKKELPDVVRKSAQCMAQSKTPAAGLLVCNTNSWEVTDWVEVDVDLGAGWKSVPGIHGSGAPLPSETISAGTWDDGSIKKARIGFAASVPPMGYRFYRLVENGSSEKSTVQTDGHEIENRFFKVSVEPTTGIMHLFTTEGEKILEGNEVVIDEEIGDLYFHVEKSDEIIGSESGEGNRFGAFKPGKIEIERSALRSSITYTSSFYTLRWPYYLREKYDPILYRHKTVDICKKVTIYKDIPRIDCFTTLNLQQSHVRIRLKFDTCMAAPEYTRQTQFGVIPLSKAKTLEETVKVPSLSWINCDEGTRGLAFLTKGVPVNEIRQGELFYTLIRSVSVLSSDGISGPLIPTPGAMELGEHEYHYSIYPHDGNWQDVGIPRRGAEMSQSLVCYQADTEPLQESCSLISIEPENLILSTLKKAEQNESLILRLYESEGERCTAVITVPDTVKTAEFVNLIEAEPSPAPLKEGRLIFDVEPFEIVTLRLQ